MQWKPYPTVRRAWVCRLCSSLSRFFRRTHLASIDVKSEGSILLEGTVIHSHCGMQSCTRHMGDFTRPISSVVSREGCGLWLCVGQKQENLCSYSFFDFEMTIKCAACSWSRDFHSILPPVCTLFNAQALNKGLTRRWKVTKTRWFHWTVEEICKLWRTKKWWPCIIPCLC